MATEASPGLDMGVSCGSTSAATQPRRGSERPAIAGYASLVGGIELARRGTLGAMAGSLAEPPEAAFQVRWKRGPGVPAALSLELVESKSGIAADTFEGARFAPRPT